MISLGKIQPFKVKHSFESFKDKTKQKSQSLVGFFYLKKREIYPIKLEFLSKNYEHVSLIYKTFKKKKESKKRVIV